MRPVSKIGIHCAVLYLKVTRTYLWRIGWRIIIILRCAFTLQYLSSVAQEQGCSLSRFGLKSFEVVHNEVVRNEYSCISGDIYFTLYLSTVNVVNVYDNFLHYHNLEFDIMIILRYIRPLLTNQTIKQGFIHDNKLFHGSYSAVDVTEHFSAKKYKFAILNHKSCFRKLGSIYKINLMASTSSHAVSPPTTSILFVTDILSYFALLQIEKNNAGSGLLLYCTNM